MIKTLITAIITYLATSIDEIPVLFMLYMNAKNKGKGKTITLTYFLGTFLLVAVGLLGAFGLDLITAKWAIGLIGFLPIIMGIKILIKGDDDEDEAMEKAKKFSSLWLKVLVITIALGADDLGVYIPLFTTMTGWEIVQMCFVFTVGTAILCLTSYRLTRIEKLSDFIEKQERFIVSVVFIVIGIFVMIECKTVTSIVSFLS